MWTDGLYSLTRQEVRDGEFVGQFKPRPQIKEYYYIDYRRAVDSIKYKIWMVTEHARNNRKNEPSKKEFSCPRCKAQFQTLDLNPLSDLDHFTGNWRCPKCDFPKLTQLVTSEQGPDEDDEVAKLNNQLKPFSDLLVFIDATDLDETTGEAAVEAQLPLPRDEVVDPGKKMNVVPEEIVRPMAVRGIVPKAEKIDVSISTSSEATAAEQAAAAERKARLAAQNQLPVWHTQSTVSATATGKENGVATSTSVPMIANGVDDDEEKKKVNTLEVDYFALLEAERAKQATSEDEEEDEDDFEDVPVEGAATTTDGPSPKKMKLSPAEEVKAEERLKVETPGSSAPVSVAASAGGDESEEDEFEDAM